MVQPPDGDTPASLDQRLIRALEHPVRVKYLTLLASRGSLSPAEALPILKIDGVALSNLTYHVRVLDQIELVEPTGEPQPSGGIAFRATPKGENALAALGFSPREENGT